LDRTSGKLVSVFPGVSLAEADFTNDGQWVAYASADTSLWKRRADGSGSVQLSFPPQRIELPRWSPDGKWIAFMGRRDPSDTYQVYLIPAEGGEWTAVWRDEMPQGAPTWSPDGARLAFGNLLPGDVPSSRVAIHLVDVKTHEATIVPGSTGLWTARWSPDGRWIAALTRDSKGLMVYDLQSGRWRKLATAGSISDLNWSHNSEWVYFKDHIPPDGPAIFRVRLRDSKVEEVASLTGSTPIRSPWLGLAPDDSPLLVPDVGINEIYALDWEAP
jgi:Tol biopolymer transport system component